MEDQYTKASPSFQKAISHQIELILESPDFNATPQQIAFLKFVVNHALIGKSGEINDLSYKSTLWLNCGFRHEM